MCSSQALALALPASRGPLEAAKATAEEEEEEESERVHSSLRGMLLARFVALASTWPQAAPWARQSIDLNYWPKSGPLIEPPAARRQLIGQTHARTHGSSRPARPPANALTNRHRNGTEAATLLEAHTRARSVSRKESHYRLSSLSD